MDLRLLKSVAKFVWRCSLGISILVMAFFCLDLAISLIFNGKQGTNENLADRMIEPYMLNALPPSAYNETQKQPEINTLRKYETDWVFTYKVNGTHFRVGNKLVEPVVHNCLASKEIKPYTVNRSYMVLLILDDWGLYSVSQNRAYVALEPLFIRCFDREFKAMPIQEKHLALLMDAVNRPGLKENPEIQAQIRRIKEDGIINYLEFIATYDLAQRIGVEAGYKAIYNKI